MKYAVVLLLVIAMLIPLAYAEKPITEESFVYHESSKSEIKEKPLITINITPFLSSGKLLDRKVHERELPVEQSVTNLVEHVNNGVKRVKIVQVYPEALVEMSDDAETVKQSPTKGKVRHELYYGYQNVTDNVPWKKYYKVENCGAEFCRVVRADFVTRQVWIEEIPLSVANGISGLPAYEALPKGVLI